MNKVEVIYKIKKNNKRILIALTAFIAIVVVFVICQKLIYWYGEYKIKGTQSFISITNFDEMSDQEKENVKLATTSFVARYKNGCFATSRGTGLEPCTS